MTRPIGGCFALEDPQEPSLEPLRFHAPRRLLLVNARSAIFVLSKLLSPSVVWVPSYVCNSVVAAVRASGSRVAFYEIDGDLHIPSMSWLEQVERDHLVIFVDYFGFPHDSAHIRAARERGAWVLEDACQALLSDIDTTADFVVFSPRKFVGVPDGGVLVSTEDVDLGCTVLAPAPPEWWLLSLSANLLRRDFDLTGETRRWFELSQAIELNAPCAPLAMSDLSATLLEHGFDFGTIARQRLDNYRLLGRELRDVAVWPSTANGVVPLGFPIRVSKRERLKEFLIAHGVYPPVHWDLKNVVPPRFDESHALSREILTLPCDQRYNRDDMTRMAALVRSFLG